ncbi:MAG: DAK2 domain-containing protein [Acidaminococcaceae bacterium]
MGMKQAATVTGTQLQAMLLGAYQSFEKNYLLIDNLNVFPVPDGDTGTNMMHTMAAVAKAVGKLKNATVSEVGQVAARSAILGARGNSGVILSQLLRGIGKGLVGKAEASNNEIGKAFQFGILYAYRSVAQPVEGTILTVAKGMAKGARQAVRSGVALAAVLQRAIESGHEELLRTPDLLPALKEAGVVDAGGQGLLVFFEGCLAALQGERITVTQAPPEADSIILTSEPIDLQFPYCTEFIVKGTTVKEKTVRKALENLGNSLIVAVTEDVVKVHIHSKNPGLVLQQAFTWGSLHDIKIDNMMDQQLANTLPVARPLPPEKKGVAVLSVAAGSGIAEIMHSIGAEEVLFGGQSMNPPVEDFVNVIERGNAEQYILLPNNKNIILAVQQVKKLLGAMQVHYVPTTNLAQGLAALTKFDPLKTMDENISTMQKAAQTARYASLSIAVRDSHVNGLIIKKGQYLGLVEDKIVVAADDLLTVLAATIKLATLEDCELISLYYGEQTALPLAQQAATVLTAINPEWDVEVLNGGQPLYPLMLVIE